MNRNLRPSVLLPALFAVASTLVACGHPATRAECEQILDKVVEIELSAQNVKDADTIAQRKEETRKQKGEALMQRCVGKKITDAAMTCVRGATTYAQILDTCLRQ
jgi:hypothetical protein